MIDIMLDIAFIKENRGVVEKAIKDKKGEEIDLDALLELYEDRSALRGQISTLNEERNKAASERNIEEGKRLKVEGQTLEEKLRAVEKEFVSIMIKIPNVPSADTPIGPDESANKILRKWGEPKKFSFKPREHWELGEDLGIIDTKTAAEVSGARFAYLKGDLVLMQFALINFALSVLTDKEKLEQIAQSAGVKVPVTAFIPVLPPVLMKSAVMNMMGRLDPIEERYYFEKDDLVFVGSAEHTLGPMHMNHLFGQKDLPLRYVGYSTAFRREAGTYGKDMKGIIRLHQFDKLEMETFLLPEHGMAEQDFIVAIQEYFMQQLEIPYQVVIISTGDMGMPDHRQIDIEAWMPGHPSTDGSGRGAYRETHTSDYMGGFQARRLNTRVRRNDGKIEHVHMNDATAFAQRPLAVIMENYQEEDGSIKIPTVLQAYIGKEKIERSV